VTSVGSRFLISLLGAFFVTLAVLAGAGYLVAQIGVRAPRDPFRAGSFEFDLAPGWWCERESGTFVCTPPGAPPHAAIAIIAVKERSDQDSLERYEEHLRQAHPPAADANPGGKLSEVRYVKRVTLGHAQWIESLQAGSEIPNYDTYYLATVTSLLGILVTMSVERNLEDKYIQELSDMMKTLNVYQR
jgi:hypothetical protein